MDKKIEKKNWPPKKIATVGGGALFVVIILYTFVFGDQSSKLNVERERITISTVKNGPFQEFIPVTGNVIPIERFFLDVSEGGRVVEKYVEEGAFVKIGQPIIKLENPQLSLSIIYNEAQVFQQINNLRSTRLSFEQNRLSLQAQLLDLDYDILDMKRQYDINKELYEKKLASKTEYERTRDRYLYSVRKRDLTFANYTQDSLFRTAQIESLELSVKQLEASLGATKKQLENLTVRAPINGQLTALTGEIGESISAGQNLGQIDNIDSYKVEVFIDEHYITRVSPGQRGEFPLGGRNYSLVIKTVYPQVTNGRFRVDMHFDGEVPDGIRRGQTTHIKLELGESKEALLVDRGGFYQTTGGQWVFVLDESGNSASRRNIRLGNQNPQVFEVLEGLKPGDQVITSSYDNYGDIEKLVIND